MPDIAMCPREYCALANRCRRSRRSGTEPSKWQTWSDFGPVGSEDCGGWWPAAYYTPAPPPALPLG